MSDLLASPLGSLSIACLVVIQFFSFLVLLVASYQFNKVVHSRAQFFSAMDLSEKSYGVRTKQFLLLSYILTIVLASVGFDLLFVYQPHLF